MKIAATAFLAGRAIDAYCGSTGQRSEEVCLSEYEEQETKMHYLKRMHDRTNIFGCDTFFEKVYKDPMTTFPRFRTMSIIVRHILCSIMNPPAWNNRSSKNMLVHHTNGSEDEFVILLLVLQYLNGLRLNFRKHGFAKNVPDVMLLFSTAYQQQLFQQFYGSYTQCSDQPVVVMQTYSGWLERAKKKSEVSSIARGGGSRKELIMIVGATLFDERTACLTKSIGYTPPQDMCRELMGWLDSKRGALTSHKVLFTSQKIMSALWRRTYLVFDVTHRAKSLQAAEPLVCAHECTEAVTSSHHAAGLDLGERSETVLLRQKLENILRSVGETDDAAQLHEKDLRQCLDIFRDICSCSYYSEGNDRAVRPCVLDAISNRPGRVIVLCWEPELCAHIARDLKRRFPTKEVHDLAYTDYSSVHADFCIKSRQESSSDWTACVCVQHIHNGTTPGLVQRLLDLRDTFTVMVADAVWNAALVRDVFIKQMLVKNTPRRASVIEHISWLSVSATTHLFVSRREQTDSILDLRTRNNWLKTKKMPLIACAAELVAVDLVPFRAGTKRKLDFTFNE